MLDLAADGTPSPATRSSSPFWAVRPEVELPDLALLLQEQPALRPVLARRLVREAAAELRDLDSAEVRSYLTRTCLLPAPEELAGLEEFYRRAHAHGLILSPGRSISGARARALQFQSNRHGPRDPSGRPVPAILDDALCRPPDLRRRRPHPAPRRRPARARPPPPTRSATATTTRRSPPTTSTATSTTPTSASTSAASAPSTAAPGDAEGYLLPFEEIGAEDRGDPGPQRHRHPDAGRRPPGPAALVLRGPAALHPDELPGAPRPRLLAAGDQVHRQKERHELLRASSRASRTPGSCRSPAAAPRSSPTRCARTARLPQVLGRGVDRRHAPGAPPRPAHLGDDDVRHGRAAGDRASSTSSASATCRTRPAASPPSSPGPSSTSTPRWPRCPRPTPRVPEDAGRVAPLPRQHPPLPDQLGDAGQEDRPGGARLRRRRHGLDHDRGERRLRRPAPLPDEPGRDGASSPTRATRPRSAPTSTTRVPTPAVPPRSPAPAGGRAFRLRDGPRFRLASV